MNNQLTSSLEMDTSHIHPSLQLSKLGAGQGDILADLELADQTSELLPMRLPLHSNCLRTTRSAEFDTELPQPQVRLLPAHSQRLDDLVTKANDRIGDVDFLELNKRCDILNPSWASSALSGRHGLEYPIEMVLLAYGSPSRVHLMRVFVWSVALVHRSI